MTYYPKLSNLININQYNLPEFLEGELESFLSGIFYRNYYSSVSSDNSQKFAQIELVFYDKLRIKVLGAESLEVVFFPDTENNTLISVGLEFMINYKILKLINDFKGISKENIDYKFMCKLPSLSSLQ